MISFLRLLVAVCYSHEPSGNALLSSRRSSFIDFLSSGLEREFLSIGRRSVSRVFGNIVSSLTYNADHQRNENKIVAKGTNGKIIAFLKRLKQHCLQDLSLEISGVGSSIKTVTK